MKEDRAKEASDLKAKTEKKEPEPEVVKVLYVWNISNWCRKKSASPLLRMLMVKKSLFRQKLLIPMVNLQLKKKLLRFGFICWN